MSPNQFREGFHVSLGGARNKSAVLDNPILRTHLVMNSLGITKMTHGRVHRRSPHIPTR
jgi:hypothetical protein